MTHLQKTIIVALSKCSIYPGTFDKRFVNNMTYFKGQLSEKQNDILIKLLHKYRRQIKEYDEICLELNPDDFNIKIDLFGNIQLLKAKKQ